MTVATGTTTKLLQRQIMPLDRDFDVLALYIDAEAAILDADKYEIGTNRGAKEMHAASMRQSTSTGRKRCSTTCKACGRCWKSGRCPNR